MFVAEVVFLGCDKGGRYSPPQSGFKPQILVGDIKTSCTVTSTENTDTMFEFDKLYTVKLKLMFQEEYGDKLSPASKIELYEGNKKIAEGKIKSIL